MEPDQQLLFEMRARGRTHSDGEQQRRRESPSYKDKIIIERKLKPGDTLNKIAIQYAVTVSELKRANNLISDHDFLPLTMVKIPVSRMRHALDIGLDGSGDDDEEGVHSTENTRLIQRHSLNSIEQQHSRDTSVEEIFHKTDSVIAQARENLPEEQIPGSFHFVDARPPDSGFSVWALLAGVVVIFMVIPLVLTFYEETENDG